MDFGSLLQTAHQNNRGKNGSSFYKTKFEPPKKEAKSKSLSSNIQKFLAKKEEEERKKADEMKRKRDEFLAMRDPKATNKIRKMLKVTKSANRSVLEDAINTVNTAVTMHGPDQPDEDDYGYVSQEAAAFYSKMMEKYKNVPDMDKFSSRKNNVNQDLSSTKDRVRAAIMRQREEETQPHKRKRRSHTDDAYAEVDEPKVSEKKEEKPRPKKPAPPPLDFNELLKIAEKKQFEPVVIETKKPEVVEESERLMTKKQKREYEEHKAYREARLRREKDKAAGISSKPENPKLKPEVQPKSINPSNMRIPKISDRSNLSPAPSSSIKGGLPLKMSDKKVVSKPEFSSKIKREEIDRSKINMAKPPLGNQNNLPSNSLTSKSPMPTSSNRRESVNNLKDRQLKVTKNDRNPMPSTNRNEKLMPNNENRSSNDPKNQKPYSKPSSEKGQTAKLDYRLEKKPNDIQTNKNMSTKSPAFPISKKPDASQINGMKKSLNAGTSANNSQKTRQFPPSDVQKTRQFPPSDVQKTRQFPPSDVQKIRQFPPSDARGLKRPLTKEEKMRREKLKKRRIVDDDESEYDSSLEDFIDDGPDDSGDVSTYIKEIFGYDKSRYKDMDDDDKNMESNFSQVMREEFISKKIGLMEDLEDMKMEAMEKKKKMMKKRPK